MLLMRGPMVPAAPGARRTPISWHAGCNDLWGKAEPIIPPDKLGKASPQLLQLAGRTRCSTARCLVGLSFRKPI